MISSVLVAARPAVVAAVFVLAGCDGSPPTPHLPGARADETPVILIPGIEATSLVEADNGRPVWSANPRLLIDNSSFGSLAVPISPKDGHGAVPLVPGSIIRGLLTTDYYGALIDALERERGPCVLPERMDAHTACVLQNWDWRLGIPKAAARLERTVDRLRALRGEPGLKVDLIGHSAGGVVARYFVRFGGRDVLSLSPSDVPVDFAGAPKVRQAILIAAPNDGSMMAVRFLLRGHRIGIAHMQPELLATMPGIYQTLPTPDRPWLIDPHGAVLKRDLYDVGTWRALRGSIFDPVVARRVRGSAGGPKRLAALETYFAQGLEKGRRLRLALSKPTARRFSYSVLAGDCRPTPERFVEEEGPDGQGQVRVLPEEVESPESGVDYSRLMLAPGDGWVTRASALGEASSKAPFGIANSVFSCTGHSLLAADPLMRHNLLAQLRWQVAGASLASAADSLTEHQRFLAQSRDSTPVASHLQ